MEQIGHFTYSELCRKIIIKFAQFIKKHYFCSRNHQDTIMDIAKKDLDGNSQIVLYQPNETISIEVMLDVEYDTVWLTQQQMVELFASSKANISEHISNIFQQGELQPESTVRKFRIVRKEGARTVTRTIDHYNLDVIISVGFRVNSRQGISFRQWANKVLKEYLLRGYAVHQQIKGCSKI